MFFLKNQSVKKELDFTLQESSVGFGETMSSLAIPWGTDSLNVNHKRIIHNPKQSPAADHVSMFAEVQFLQKVCFRQASCPGSQWGCYFSWALKLSGGGVEPTGGKGWMWSHILLEALSVGLYWCFHSLCSLPGSQCLPAWRPATSCSLNSLTFMMVFSPKVKGFSVPALGDFGWCVLVRSST